MKTQTSISYAELAKRVGDMVLFNNHNQADPEWHQGIIEQPLMRERLDAIDEENRGYELKRIEESTDEGEKAKLTEELEDMENASVFDFEIYQSYTITQGGAEYLANHTGELISYSEKLDLWLWHIGHYGTSWSGVYTTFTEYDIDDDVERFYSHEDLMKLTVM